MSSPSASTVRERAIDASAHCGMNVILAFQAVAC